MAMTKLEAASAALATVLDGIDWRPRTARGLFSEDDP